MLKPLLLLSSLILFEFAAAPNPRPLPQDAAQAPATAEPRNPVKPTSESQAKAKKTYGFDCALCHGASGDGKTDLARDMQLTMTDLSDPKTLAGKTDGELFEIIRKGKDKMPAEAEDRAKNDDVWNLVIYVRGLSRNSAAAANQ